MECHDHRFSLCFVGPVTPQGHLVSRMASPPSASPLSKAFTAGLGQCPVKLQARVLGDQCSAGHTVGERPAGSSPSELLVYTG